jgi:peroxiredoxin family protein
MAADAPGRLSLVVLAGDYDRVHYALSMASCAAAVDRPVTLFFTMGALRALKRDAGGVPGWTQLGPASNGRAPALRDSDHAEAGLATFEELLAACVELGVTIMVCEMGLRAEGLAADDLRDDVSLAEGGLVTFLAGAGASGQVVVV